MKHAARCVGLGAATLVLAAASACGGGSDAAQSASPSAASPACQGIAAKYSSLKGKNVVVGTSPGPDNYVAPDPDDPSKVIGIEPDLLATVAQCVGFTTSYQKLDFNGLIPALQANQVQAVAGGMYASDERAKQISFVEYMKAGEAAVVAKGNPKQLTTLDATCGATAAEVVGTVENAILDKQSKACTAAGKPAITALTFQANEQAVQAVSAKRADIFLTDAGVASFLAKKEPTVETAFPVSSDYVFGIGVAKTDTALLNAIHDTLSDLYTSGQLKALVAKWSFAPEQLYQPTIKS